MDWLVPALITMVLWVGFNLLVKFSSKELDPMLGALILSVVAAVPILIYAAFKFLDKIEWSKVSTNGIALASLGGILAGLATIFYFQTYSKGGTLSVTLPLIMVGNIAIIAIIGVFVFKEELTLLRIIGLGLGLLSVYFLTS